MHNNDISDNNIHASTLSENTGSKVRGRLLHGAGVLILAGIAAVIWKSGFFEDATPTAIRDMILLWGPWGPVLYLVLFTFVPLTLFPDAVLAIASGMAFGMAKGFFLTWLGALCGGSLAFFLARLIGRESMEKLQVKLGHKPRAVPVMTGFLSILLLRLIPLVPFDVISYGAGLSQVRYRDFIGATALGIIPGVCVFVNLGDKLFDCNSSQFYCALALLVGLTVLSALGARYMRKPLKPEHSKEAAE